MSSGPFRSRVVLSIHSNDPVGTLRDIMSDSSSRPLPFARKVMNYFHALSASARNAQVFSGVADQAGTDAVAASQTVTLSTHATAADTLTINGVVLTAEASGAGNNQWNVTSSAAGDAAAIAAAINSSTSVALSGVVHASANAAVVTVSCNIAGVIGNNIALSKSSSAMTLGGATLANGSGSLPVLTAFSFGK